MKLSKLIKGVKVLEIIGNTEIDIEDIKIDSKEVGKNTLFICLSGRSFDGHDYVKQVESYGAVAIITQKKVSSNLVQIVVEDTRKAMSIIAGNFYDNPAKKLKIIGVTGTNGKTTTCHIVKKIMDQANISCGLIGTLGTYYNDKYVETDLTTPDPINLHKIFFDMVNAGVKVVVMEVSAHAIALKKLENIFFDVGVFTNLTQDHLDYFHDMKTYKNAKLSYFKSNNCKYIVSNSDDDVGVEISNLSSNSITYGIKNPADVFAIKIKQTKKGTEFVINLFDCIYEIKLDLIGKFNVYNALAAATASALVGVKPNKVYLGLNAVSNINGRLEKVYDKNFSVYVDYAHTPDGLKKSILALKEICKGKLITVFGCGGNRDKDKRKKMGKISGEYSDFSVITSDNPRFEDPMEIIFNIEKGIRESSKNYVIVQDRSEGIKYALNYAKDFDIVLVAGKGGEKYEDVLGIKKPYNDKDTIKELLGE